MPKLQSILLATDLRPASRQAGKVAVQLAAAFGARIMPLHAIEPLPHWPVEQHRPHKEAPLRDLVAELRGQGVEVADPTLVVGPPADTILHQAQQVDAGLIVMGAGDRTGDFRAFCGPVALTVAEFAPQPVLLVRPGEPPIRFQKVLCPIDHSETARRGLEHAILLARQFGSELVVLSVVPEVNWLAAAMETGQFAAARTEYDKQWRAEFDKALAAANFDNVKMQREVRQGSADEQIAAAAQEHQADVLIMGATGRTGLARILLGSTTRRVLQRLPCSLLMVKDKAMV